MITVEVVYALPARQYARQLDLKSGARVKDALDAVADAEGFEDVDLGNAAVGIYGREVQRDRLLEDGDRVEVYRPLQVDPMTARRQRAERQKAALDQSRR